MNAIQTAFSSARFNRLMFWVGGGILAAGVILLVFTLVGGSDKTRFGPDKDFKPALPAQSRPLKNAQGVTVKTFWQLDPQVRSTIRTFIATAVARKHLGASWDVVAPSVKAGYTYEHWKNADALPIIPYPVENVDHAQYYLDYALTREILIDVGLSAKHELKLRPTTFQVGLSLIGTGAHPQWLVDYWMPRWTPPLPAN
jgi:hypothetical protein